MNIFGKLLVSSQTHPPGQNHRELGEIGSRVKAVRFRIFLGKGQLFHGIHDQARFEEVGEELTHGAVEVILL